MNLKSFDQVLHKADLYDKQAKSAVAALRGEVSADKLAVRQKGINAAQANVDNARTKVELGKAKRELQLAEKRLELDKLKAAADHKHKFGGIFSKGTEDLFPSDIAAKLLKSDKITPKQMNNVLDLLKRTDPSTYRNVQVEASNYLRAELLRPNKMASDTSVTKLLLNQSEKLESLFGKEYVKNLRTLQMLNNRYIKKGDIMPAKNTENYLSRIIRVIVGPLAAANRRVSFMRDEYRAHSINKAMGWITDPEKLDTLIKWMDMKPGTQAAARIAGSLGLNSYLRAADPDLAEEIVEVNPEWTRFRAGEGKDARRLQELEANFQM